MEQVPYFCQFWNEQSARFLAQKSSLYLVPILSLPSIYEDRKSKGQEEDLLDQQPEDVEAVKTSKLSYGRGVDM